MSRSALAATSSSDTASSQALEAATNGNKDADFNGIFAGLDDGSYDCIASGTTITPGRRKLAEFCAPYA
jgi:ABC-type amino acid transport substrate-binding protein